MWIRAFVKIYSCTDCTKKTICKKLEFKIFAKQGVYKVYKLHGKYGISQI